MIGIAAWIVAAAMLVGARWRLRLRARKRAKLVADGICPNCGSTDLTRGQALGLLDWHPTKRCQECMREYQLPNSDVQKRIRESREKLRSKLIDDISKDRWN